MSSSWIFPSWAKPSQAKLGNSIFELKLSRILFWYTAFLALCFVLVVYFKEKKCYSPQTKPVNAGANKEKSLSGKKCLFSEFRAEFFFQAQNRSQSNQIYFSSHSSYGVSQFSSDYQSFNFWTILDQIGQCAPLRYRTFLMHHTVDARKLLSLSSSLHCTAAMEWVNGDTGSKIPIDVMFNIY